jgi:hypothetical protein
MRPELAALGTIFSEFGVFAALWNRAVMAAGEVVAAMVVPW